MLFTRSLRNLYKVLPLKSLYRMNHIKNMIQENTRVEAQQLNDQPFLIQTNKVYKPSHTIEFNRQGEVLLYSANTLKNQTIYLKYPFIFYESLIPLSIFNYLYNPFDISWYLNNLVTFVAFCGMIPRIWDISDQKYLVQRLYLLRGGRILKAQTLSMAGDRYTYWFQTFKVKALTPDEKRFENMDEAQILKEEGQLKNNLTIQIEDMKQFGTNSNDALLRMKNYGTVHHPQLFEAAIHGYNIDTTDFVINTADNIRYHEGNHDY